MFFLRPRPDGQPGAYTAEVLAGMQAEVAAAQARGDAAEAALLQSMVHDFAYGAGVLPQGVWNWPPVTPGQPLSTFVVAQQGGFPGGGSRAVVGWKEDQCNVLEGLGFGQTYWWCD